MGKRGATRGEAGRAGAPDLADLDPEKAAIVLAALELALRRRRGMLIGYLAALLVVAFGQIAALLVWATREPGAFIAWIFLVPLAVAGIILTVTARVVRGLKPR